MESFALYETVWNFINAENAITMATFSDEIKSNAIMCILLNTSRK